MRTNTGAPGALKKKKKSQLFISIFRQRLRYFKPKESIKKFNMREVYLVERVVVV